MKTWVLLRGLARESGHWGDFIPQLQAAMPGDRIVPLDLPGNGTLNGQASPLRVDAMRQACRAALDRLGVRPPLHLLGVSLGGMVVASWMQAHADEVAGGVLINTSLRPISPLHHRLRPGAWWPLLRSAAVTDASGAEALILGLTSNDASRRRAVLPAWVALRRERPVSVANALRQLVAASRFRLDAAAPKVPVLLLCSRADRLVDARCSQALALRWRCPMSVHPGAGHDLTLDAGDWVAAEVARHFADRA
ncbi:alpha/beta fold hydrolase [Ideonella sp. A 288]|uniref:alpha/beta fold hydrolase n=1 Tax=Ideonella sp. A 288 TaxID=1962181 RepID=UPI000B4A63B5|nr:alpha/beta hydrolase [Ideonella sp. A 288]